MLLWHRPLGQFCFVWLRQTLALWQLYPMGGVSVVQHLHVSIEVDSSHITCKNLQSFYIDRC